MHSPKEVGQPTPLVVAWPLLYANKELIGEGTLLKLSTDRSCHVAGTMPVAVGMVLKVWISPANRDEALYLQEARVVWVRGHEFGIELRQVDLDDHQWLMRLLINAERDIASGNSFVPQGSERSSD